MNVQIKYNVPTIYMYLIYNKYSVVFKKRFRKIIIVKSGNIFSVILNNRSFLEQDKLLTLLTCKCWEMLEMLEIRIQTCINLVIDRKKGHHKYNQLRKYNIVSYV